jgi:phenylacetate-coenzyme A ligase PaaK-like adenylate-forming protein
MRDTDLLFAPSSEPVDADLLIQAAMHWHFDDATGSRFWLDRRDRLSFDPRSEVTTLGDLRRFPNFVDELRDVPIEDLIPRGFGDRPELISVIESGGTTGTPKRLPLLREFAERMTHAEVAWLEQVGALRTTGWLALFPSGPHGALDQMRRTASAYGDRIAVFAVDLDPRWVKRSAERGDTGTVDAYTDHVIAQAATALETQDVSVLRITPPLLARMTRDDRLTSLIAEKIRLIIWGGAHMDADSRAFYRDVLFPDTLLFGRYGTTMALGAGCVERSGLAAADPCAMDPSMAPRAMFEVRDPETGEQTPHGDRGQVVAHLVSASMLLPNNAERDTAIRVHAPKGVVGDSLADVEPMRAFAGAPVIEGVY